MPSLRLFFALETPPDVRAEMALIQEDLRSTGADVRWEPAEKLHATLKFLGDTDVGLLPEIVLTIEGVLGDFGKPIVRYAGLGCFPDRREPRVIWIGMADTGASLLSLQEAVERALVPLGFPREKRVFQPHITLGRVKSRRGIGRLLDRMESTIFESQPVSIPDVVLMRSELKPAGSVYTPQRVFSLK